MSFEGVAKKYHDAWPEVAAQAEVIPNEIDPEAIEKQVVGCEVLEELWRDVLEYASDYLEVLCQYLCEEKEVLSSKDDREVREDFQLIDEVRRRKHNAFASSLEILARNMVKSGLDGSWYNKFEKNRAKMGLWAIKLGTNKIIEHLHTEQNKG